MYKRFSILCLLFSFSISLKAQENSPYARYGLGNISSTENIIHMGMGGVAVADDNLLTVNPTNPAAHASLKLTTINFGMRGVMTNLKTTTLSAKTGATYIQYINIGMPIGKNAGLSFGLLPYASSRYSMEENVSYTPQSSSVNSYFGGGSLQKFFIGGGYKYKHLAIGLQSGYLFGSIQNSSEQAFADTQKTLYTNYIGRKIIGGAFVHTGIIYSIPLKDSLKKINLAASYTIGSKVNSTLDQYTVTSNTELGASSLIDTISKNENYRGKIALPAELRLGSLFKYGDYWQVGIEYRTTAWNNYSYYGNRDANLKTNSSFHLGASYTPDINDVNALYKKFTYRIGGTLGTDYLSFNNTQLQKQSLTAGLSAPLGRTRMSIGQLSTALEIGKRGTTDNGLIREGYTRFSVGISLNDRWFIKRKYD